MRGLRLLHVIHRFYAYVDFKKSVKTMSALKRKAATQLEKSSREIDTDDVESSPMREASEGVLLSESPMQPSSLTDDCSTTLQETETELVGSNPDLIVEDAPYVGDPLIDEASKNEIPVGAEGVEQVALSTKAGLPESNVRVAPKKIKHPSSAWMIFSHENREKIQKDQPSLTFTEGPKWQFVCK